MDYISLVFGAIIGFIVAILRDYINIKNKTNHEYKINKQQKLEELLKLLEITNQGFLISMKLKLAEDKDEQIHILEKILEEQFENSEIIKYKQDNYAKIKAITALYLNQYINLASNHIELLKNIDIYRQISIENAIKTINLENKFGNLESIEGEYAQNVLEHNQKFQKDKQKEEQLEKMVSLSFIKLQDIIIEELKV